VGIAGAPVFVLSCGENAIAKKNLINYFKKDFK
jgi:hypothetical protein